MSTELKLYVRDYFDNQRFVNLQATSHLTFHKLNLLALQDHWSDTISEGYSHRDKKRNEDEDEDDDEDDNEYDESSSESGSIDFVQEPFIDHYSPKQLFESKVYESKLYESVVYNENEKEEEKEQKCKVEEVDDDDDDDEKRFDSDSDSDSDDDDEEYEDDHHNHRLHDDEEEEEDEEEDEEEEEDKEEDEDEEEEDDEDDEDDDEDEEDENSVSTIIPCKLSEQIYRFRDYRVVQHISNTSHRHVYLVVPVDGCNQSDISSQYRVIVICKESEDIPSEYGGIPREVYVMYKLQQNVENGTHICNILGWYSFNKHTYAMLLPYYPSINPIYTNSKDSYCIAKVIYSLLVGLNKLHSAGIAHRDICFDNVRWNVFKDELTIIDFDSSAPIRESGFYKRCGRDEFNAPEQLALYDEVYDDDYGYGGGGSSKSRKNRKSKPFSEKVDMYAVGVMMYMLLKQYVDEPDNKQIRQFMKKCRSKGHSHVPEIDLVLKLLCYDPLNRISAKDALNHPFFDILKLPSSIEYKNMQLVIKNDSSLFRDV